jgi:F-box and WD-40 domain protein CDC4
MSTPPQHPLLNTGIPFSCRLRSQDEFVFHQNIPPFLANKTTQKAKKRPAEEAQRTMKRRLREAYDEGDDEIDDLEMLEIPEQEEDNNLANQIPLDTQQMPPPQQNGTAYENTTELPLPSPSASPKQMSHLEDYMDEDDQDVVQMESTGAIELIERYATTSLSRNAQNQLLFKLLQHADRAALSELTNVISSALKRDFLTSLPTEISIQILKQLDHKSVNNVLLVSKSWNRFITEKFWKDLLLKDNYTTKEELQKLEPKLEEDSELFHKLYTERFNLHRNWLDPNFEPRKITAPGHGANVVTCLQFDDEKIITGADDKMINIYDPENGKLLKILSGHEGGVWALKYIGKQIVSGSTDRTVRVWNLELGKCTHVFRGHTSTIRCMEIVTNDEGETFIVTGSRDNTLHVWRLPDEDDYGEDFDQHDPHNPYFVTVLRGHTASVRAVTGLGNTIISGSYDHTVRVWDLKTRENKFILRGHTDRIYSTILDVERNRCISASMDSTIRVWDLNTGECISELTKHTSLVGLLGLSSDFLVSAAADGTLRGWNPENYQSEFVLHQDNHSAITTFFASPNILVSGSEGQFNIYDLRDNGRLIRSNVLADSGPIWSAKFNYSKCVVAVEKNSQSFIEILDFSKSA